MSVVVWDGQSLALDRGATDGVTMWELDKWWKDGDDVLTGVGHHATLVALRDWYLAGRDLDTFPRLLQPAELVVVTGGRLHRYEHTSPRPIDHGTNKCAFGAGRDFAYGAMAMGATAEQAAQVACGFSVACGHGVKVFRFD
jgi:hypothetical protein